MERVAWWNGEFVPESHVLISFRDSAAVNGEGVYDTARTFGGRVFKLREHLERLRQSLAYVRIEPPLPMDELEEISLEVARRNCDAFGTDFWLTQRVTRQNTIVECAPLPFAERARYYRDGVDLVTSTIRRTPPWAQSPQAKTMSILNIRLAEMEVRARDPEAWPLLCDEHGNLAEGWGSNVFVVRGGAVLTPQRHYVLAGVTRDTVIDLARGLGLDVRECDIGLYEATTADELFITSTSFCVCPARSLNGARTRERAVPGPVTRRLQEAFRELVDFDFVAQYLEHLEAPAAR